MLMLISKAYVIRYLLKLWLGNRVRLFVCVLLTEFVEVCLYAVRSWYRANDTGFLKSAPFINQTTLTANIILDRDRKRDRHTEIIPEYPFYADLGLL